MFAPIEAGRIEMEEFTGSVHLFPYNFEIQGWMACDGRQLPINQYTALFSLLGTRYGGNGTTTFGIPKMDPVASANGDPLTYQICIQGLYPERQ
jgi:microcystin-dependent protein